MVQLESDSELDRGDAAPDFELAGADGETYALNDFEMEALLVVFTCNHCPYAKAKIDLLNDLAAEYDDLAVVGINPNDADAYPEDSLDAMREAVADGTVAYDAYLRDETGAVAAAYDAVCTPDPFLFGREDGGWRLRYHGRLDDALNPDDEPTELYVRDAVDAVLADEAVEIPDQPSRGCSIKSPTPGVNAGVCQ
ncbi:alkyl hydroperoxide reductase/ thiol specific antioxidant/ Mal allergen [Halorubrum californiense DSM 19288]|uniref:Alkyl hydroperoxide reductase/ thiol specific antioxidant/ Mal allergen n=1 Tax=Halorubrum californiense DSM 19288 TaxID=1227465 RepID=M0DXP2_9EURY|nr:MULTISPECIES: thioredoxin family protein [Halorubrum]ELZ40276.1 alkyl hydroperoxide reductase/ thiol specific antioxidant/ Mal allergen [Halorubrum californiense DSM 19288]TKX68531.1 thioredoxin family protein [Halorubrum sp. GN11GM_10-3_MGM]